MAGFPRGRELEEAVPQRNAERRSALLSAAWKFASGHGAVMAVFSLTGFFIIWQLTSDYLISPFLIPPPTAVVRAAIPMMYSGEYFQDVGISLVRIFIGFATGTATAVFLGLLLGRLRVVRQLLDPIIEVLRYLSPTAMIPIAVIWFGIGEMSKYFLIFWGTFFIIVISTIDGVLRVPVTRVRAAQCLGASRIQIFTQIIIPTILPAIITGMRLAMASSFMSIIPAEMLAADSGIGYLLQASAALAQTDRIFVALVTISVLGVIVDSLFRFMARHLLHRYTVYLAAS
jgi:ABC-type nitrate/sulfonate/bicarbonate transport system permease component